MNGRRAGLAIAVIMAVTVAAAWLPGCAALGAGLSSPTLAAASQASGPVPLPPGCSPANANSPHAALDPSDPSRIALAYTAGDSVAGIVATSHDGGQTWARSVLPGMTACTGGPDGGIGDPMLAMGSDGRVVVSEGWVSNSPTTGIDYPYVRLLADGSADGGVTFSGPVEPDPGQPDQRGPLSFDPASNDSLLIAFERVHYLNNPTFDRLTGGFLFGSGGALGVARSLDGGTHWQPAVTAVPGIPGTDLATIALLRSNGGIVLIGARVQTATVPAWVAGEGLPQDLFSVRSDDGGQTWTGPEPIGTYFYPHGSLAGFAIPSAAVAPDGTLYATWPHFDPLTNSYGAVSLAASHDGGLHWSEAQVLSTTIGLTGAAVEPAVAAGNNGRVGLFFYDNPTGGWLAPRLATSADGGTTWTPTTLAPAFDTDAIQNASSDGTPVGPYQDIVATPSGFAVAVTLGAGTSEDVWWFRERATSP